MGSHNRFVVENQTKKPPTRKCQTTTKLEWTFRGRIISNATKNLWCMPKVLFVTLQKFTAPYTERMAPFPWTSHRILVDEANVIRLDYDSLAKAVEMGFIYFTTTRTSSYPKRAAVQPHLCWAKSDDHGHGLLWTSQKNPKVYEMGLHGLQQIPEKHSMQRIQKVITARGPLLFRSQRSEAITGSSTKGGLILFWDK